MATAGERKALWFLALVALSGSSVRLFRSRHPEPPPRALVAVEKQIERVDAAASQRPRRGRARRSGETQPPPAPKTSAPLPPERSNGPIDVNLATREQLTSLPGIGPALAGRVIAFRDSAGPFRSMEGLCRVRGIGPSLAKKLLPLVTFNGVPSPVSAGCDEGSRTSRK